MGNEGYAFSKAGIETVRVKSGGTNGTRKRVDYFIFHFTPQVNRHEDSHTDAEE